MPEINQQESSQQMPTVPTPNGAGGQPNTPGKILKVVFIILILAALAFVGVFIYLAKVYRQPPTAPAKQPETKQAETKQPVDYSQPTPQNISLVRITLLANAKLTFPKITSSTTLASANDLPKELAVLLPPGSTETLLQAVTFQGNGTGYLLHYAVPQTMADFFKSQNQSLTSQPGWQVIDSVQADVFAVLEAENAHYQARLEHTVADNGQDRVVVTVLKK